MKTKSTLISTVLCLLPLILSALLYRQLPEQVAIHFNSAGAPDSYVPKAVAAFVLPVLLAAVNVYLHFRVTQDPKVENASVSLRTLTMWIVPALSLIINPITLFMALGRRIPIGMIAAAMAGLLIITAGNYMPKCKRNYTIGIKLPWTLDSEENWNHTHRFSGFLWVAGGLVMTINAFFQLPYVSTGIVACLLVLPFVYSYLFYRRNGRNTGRG